jgi:hypothetical protein
MKYVNKMDLRTQILVSLISRIPLWRYRCDAEWLATAENEVDEEDGGRDTF